MASLVAEILLSTGQLEKRDFQSEIEKINKQIEDAKFQVVKFLEQHYDSFNPLLVHSKELAVTTSDLKSEMKTLIEKTQVELKFQVECSTSELTSISSQINAAKIQINLLERVALLHDLLGMLKKTNPEDNILKYATTVVDAENIVDEAENKIETHLDIWNNIQLEVRKHKSEIMAYLDSFWHTNIHFEKKDGLVMKMSPCNILKDLFDALHLVGQLDQYICELSTTILEEILVPALNINSKVICNSSLEVHEGKEKVLELEKMELVFQNLSSIFQYLSEHLQFQTQSGLKAVSLIGNNIGDAFAKVFVKLCMRATLPQMTSELSNVDYHCLLENSTNLSRVLTDVGFFSQEGNAISEFVTNVDVFYADKKCLESMAKARQLMRADLHDTIHLSGVAEDQTINLENDEQAHLWKTLNEGGLELKLNPFTFPNCQISSSTQEFIELVSALITEVTVSNVSEKCAARLLYTVRSVCELYLCVVPEYHRDSLDQLPFHAALAHNNCMYIAHSILTLGTSHFTKTSSLIAVPFMDLVSKFRQLAAQIFLDHMKKQRNQLISMLKEGGFNRLGGEGRLPPSAEKATRQFLQHLKNLRNVWQPVLPEEVYFRAIGTLANSALEELIVRIITLEDIPADAALQLVSQCQLIARQLPLLFQNEQISQDIEKSKLISRAVNYIPLWGRFQELEYLLGASLKDIEDRWSSGKGLLATYFAADEVKQLIRALFQNTDHRAAVLARIK